ncbi:hypothetical protein Patl1_09085 [Pistacia atlantica]|uniref:Uncharacterized protein n=1 Tax=Pistacia atlantica TaxID=434234 RepID=A0ACC1AIJ5_9ROSI|nr:hypothetical protein Patl1_09085 [Pistacia atlantica]
MYFSLIIKTPGYNHSLGPKIWLLSAMSEKAHHTSGILWTSALKEVQDSSSAIHLN